MGFEHLLRAVLHFGTASRLDIIVLCLYLIRSLSGIYHLILASGYADTARVVGTVNHMLAIE